MMPLVPTDDHIPPPPDTQTVRDALALLYGPVTEQELGRLDFAYGHDPLLLACATATALWRTAARVLMETLPFGSGSDEPIDTLRCVGTFTDSILGRERAHVLRQYAGEALFTAETMQALCMTTNGMDAGASREDARGEPLIDAAASAAGAFSKSLTLAYTQLRDADRPEDEGGSPPRQLAEAVQMADFCQRSLVAWAYPRGYVFTEDDES